MRRQFYTVAIPILACVSWAQDTPPSQPQQPQQPAQSGVPSTSEDRTGGSQADPNAGQQSTRDSVSQAGTMDGTHSGRAQEAKTMTYSGTLVDASCAGPDAAGDSSATASNSSSSSSSSNYAANSGLATATNSADRSSTAGTGPTTCAVSSTTAKFALKTKEGVTYRLDDVGNSRVQEAMQKNKKWRESASANKEIKVKAKGMVSGGKLIVMSVD